MLVMSFIVLVFIVFYEIPYTDFLTEIEGIKPV